MKWNNVLSHTQTKANIKYIKIQQTKHSIAICYIMIDFLCIAKQIIHSPAGISFIQPARYRILPAFDYTAIDFNFVSFRFQALSLFLSHFFFVIQYFACVHVCVSWCKHTNRPNKKRKTPEFQQTNGIFVFVYEKQQNEDGIKLLKKRAV